jgi:CDP-diacylglycerol--glycerol-3-phosphate 3-phosphatidyltransferase
LRIPVKLPTQLTVLRIVLVPVFFVLIAIVHPPEIGWAGFVFAVAAISDWWDGHMARKMGLVTELGAFLDPLADKLLTGTAFVAFAWMSIVPWWMVIIVLARDLYLTLLRKFAANFGHPVKTSSIAKVKTFVQMTFIVLLLVELFSREGHFGTSLATIAKIFFASEISFWLMGIVTLLTSASAVMYSFDNWSTLRSVIARYGFRRTGQETI